MRLVERENSWRLDVDADWEFEASAAHLRTCSSRSMFVLNISLVVTHRLLHDAFPTMMHLHSSDHTVVKTVPVNVPRTYSMCSELGAKDIQKLSRGSRAHVAV